MAHQPLRLKKPGTVMSASTAKEDGDTPNGIRKSARNGDGPYCSVGTITRNFVITNPFGLVVFSLNDRCYRILNSRQSRKITLYHRCSSAGVLLTKGRFQTGSVRFPPLSARSRHRKTAGWKQKTVHSPLPALPAFPGYRP